MDKLLKKANKFVNQKGKKAKEIISHLAKDAEPLIKETREKIQKASLKAEEDVKQFYKEKIKRR